jgi:hypothetical protein
LQLKKDELAQDDELRLLAQKIASCQTIWTQVWHGAGSGAPTDAFMTLVQDEHRRNFDLWHEEDKARAPDASDASIATVKRSIDKFNQQRNDLIEKLDDHLLGWLKAKNAKPAPHAPWNSETPGSVIDRLSILSLKVFHMREQAERLDAKPEHIQKCRDRLKTLTQQHADLTAALQFLIEDLFAGRKTMKVYRQFKMYNDPDSNPAIYGAKQ